MSYVCPSILMLLDEGRPPQLEDTLVFHVGVSALQKRNEKVSAVLMWDPAARVKREASALPTEMCKRDLQS